MWWPESFKRDLNISFCYWKTIWITYFSLSVGPLRSSMNFQQTALPRIERILLLHPWVSGECVLSSHLLLFLDSPPETNSIFGLPDPQPAEVLMIWQLILSVSLQI